MSPELDELTFGWMIGLLEGEGCFLRPARSQPNKPRIQLQMVDEDVVARVARIWNTTYTQYHPPRFQKHGWKPVFMAQISGKRAAEWMQTLRPHMGKRRQGQIDAALAAYNPHLREDRCRISVEQAEEIRRRKERGETAQSIADSLGISLSYVYKICSGVKRQGPV